MIMITKGDLYQKNPKPKFICTPKNPLQKIFPNNFRGGVKPPSDVINTDPTPLNAYPLTRSIHGGGQVEIQGDTPKKIHGIS